MKKSLIVKSITEALGGGAGLRYVSMPQNPLVADNPDFLVADSNRLFGIYIPSQKETINSDYLLRRIYLSRLYYANDMRTIILFNQDSPLSNLKPLMAAVHYTESFEVIPQISQFVGSLNNVLDTRSMINKHTRKYALETLYKTQGLSDIFSEFEQGDYVDLKLDGWNVVDALPSWSSQRQIGLKTALQQGTAIVYSKKKGSQSVKDSLENILTYSLFRKYHLHNGQIYVNKNWNEERPISFLNTNLNISSVHGAIDTQMASTLACLGIVSSRIESEGMLDYLVARGREFLYDRNKYGKK